jgi:hypothetical protein
MLYWAMRIRPLISSIQVLRNRYGRSYWKVPSKIRRRMQLSNKFGKKTDSHAVRSTSDSLIAGLHGVPVDSKSMWSLGPFRDQPGFLLLDNFHFLSKSYTEIASSMSFISGSTYSTVSRVDVNYFHWLIESCSQLVALRDYVVLHPQPLTIVYRHDGPAFIADSIQKLFKGIDHNLLSYSGNTLKCERLLCAVYPEYSTNINGHTLSRIRDLLCFDVQGVESTHQLIYIKRKVGGWRYLLNEREFEQALSDLGFHIVQSEQMSLVQQVALFRKAKVIVGMHGAGLTNLLFADNPIVIEMRGAYGGDDYVRMCHALHYEHVLFKCNDQDHNITVDIPSLVTEIKSRLGKVGPAPTA